MNSLTAQAPAIFAAPQLQLESKSPIFDNGDLALKFNGGTLFN